MVGSIQLFKDEKNTIFENLVTVYIAADDLTTFGIPGPKGQLLLERVAQLCLEAREEINEAAE